MTPVSAVEFVTRAQGRLGPGVDGAVGGVDQPDGEDQQHGGKQIDASVEATGEQDLPEQGDKRRIEAQEIWPEPEFAGSWDAGTHLFIMRGNFLRGLVPTLDDARIALIAEDADGTSGEGEASAHGWIDL